VYFRQKQQGKEEKGKEEKVRIEHGSPVLFASTLVTMPL
jgi:hypothetical protein